MNEAIEKTQAAGTLSLQISRVIKAKRQRVYDAWIRPELIVKWFAPGDMTVLNAIADVKVGGAYSITMSGNCRNEEGGNAVATGNYTEIIPNERLCFTWGASPETFVTVEFKDVEGGTEITIRHERFETEEARAQHEQGWLGCLENLEKYLTTSND